MSSDVKGFSSHDTPGYVGFANLPNQVSDTLSLN